MLFLDDEVRLDRLHSGAAMHARTFPVTKMVACYALLWLIQPRMEQTALMYIEHCKSIVMLNLWIRPEGGRRM